MPNECFKPTSILALRRFDKATIAISGIDNISSRLAKVDGTSVRAGSTVSRLKRDKNLLKYVWNICDFRSLVSASLCPSAG
jgi:hypothetical protein